MKAWVALVAIGLLAPLAARAAPAPLGDVAFANSCAATAQAPFLRGLALLHDFEYATAAQAFRAAQAADPGCAMAYWGEAMTFNHPVWMSQEAEPARAVLARMEKAHATAPTAREAAYLHAVATLYGPGAKAARDLSYADEMAALHERFPDDVDATAFDALALLGTSHGGRDIPTYMKAAALLEGAFPGHPRHPGVLHYMIHAYDDPAHAPLGMRAARLYGAIAAGAPHAVHMTSHIFIAMGLWDGVIAANAQAIHDVNAEDGPGAPPYACGHYPEWLVYGYLQERRFAEADAAIALCGARAAAKLSKHPQPAFPETSAVVSHAEMRLRQSIETGVWRADALPAMDGGAYVEARFDAAYAACLAAGQDRAALRAALATLRAAFAGLQARFGQDKDGGQQDVAFWGVMVEEAAALDLAAAGATDDAIAALRQAARHETVIPTEFGPPAVPKPPYELLGDLLLKARRDAEAADAYRAALVRAPGRTLSLRGLRAAQQALGDTQAAATTQALLARYVR
jgi:hypothetical protein